MQVLGQDDEGVNPERISLTHLAHGGTQAVDVAHEQIVVTSFKQVDGEEIGAAGAPDASVVWHGGSVQQAARRLRNRAREYCRRAAGIRFRF